MQNLQALGLVYFCYLFLFSGLEFTLSFLTHQRFHFTRYELRDEVDSVVLNITTFWYFPLQHAARKDVFLHWHGYGFDTGGICTQDQTRPSYQSCSDGNLDFFCLSNHMKTPLFLTCFFCFVLFFTLGHFSIDPSIHPHRFVMEYHNFVHGPTLILIWWDFFFAIYSMLRHNRLNILIHEDTSFFSSCCNSCPMPLHTCFWTWWALLTFSLFLFKGEIQK